MIGGSAGENSTAAPPVDSGQLREAVAGLAAAADFEVSGLCFAATYAGLQRSTDSGLTWRAAFDAPDLNPRLPATCVALGPPGNAGRFVCAGVPGGIARSRDGGATWSLAILPPPPPFVSSLALSPAFASDATIFAGALEDGVFVSTDAGASWTAWNIGLLDWSIYCLAISPEYHQDRTLFAGTESGVFISTNGGRFWRETPFPSEHAPVLSLALSPAFGRDEAIFAGTAGNGLLASHDRGDSWRRVPLPDAQSAVNAVLLSPEFPARPQLLALTDDALLVSRDGGQSWSGWASPEPVEPAMTAVVAPLGLDPGRPLLAGCVDGRILRL